jgi:hypothetical protein
VEVELPTDPQDIENQYGAALMELERKVPPPEVSLQRKEDQKKVLTFALY